MARESRPWAEVDPEPLQGISPRLDDLAARVFVFGGFGSWMGFIQGGPPPITKKIDMPKNWAQLVKKYRNIVPTYVLY